MTTEALIKPLSGEFTDASNEPELDIHDIQGNILPGFLKDHEALLYLKIDDLTQCKKWLQQITPLIATAEEVITFNRLFKMIRHRRGYEGTVKATWVNIAFSFHALEQLTPDANEFNDQAFKEGLLKRSSGLGDPIEAGVEGNPGQWKIAGPGKEVDILLIIQSDTASDLQDEVQRIKQTIAKVSSGKSSGVRLLGQDEGADLPRDRGLSGHEHFGFRDGVSQPGVRGRTSSDPHDVLTPRRNARNENQGNPGQDLLWPGEFVFGYKQQDAKKEVKDPSSEEASAGPGWARNGSYLVFRRLRQDVFAFHNFLKGEAGKLGVPPAFLGAKLVGRWPDGSPIMRDTQHGDLSHLGTNTCANNDFEFFHPDPVFNDSKQPPCDHSISPESLCGCDSPLHFPASAGDRAGDICPFVSHIRKAYPRDDITPAGVTHKVPLDKQSDLSEQDTQTHRLLRRGLPYGIASASTLERPVQDKIDRGLLFIAYQTSITNQFEFVIQFWINNPNFSQSQTGIDKIIGQQKIEPGSKPNNDTVISLKPLIEKKEQLQIVQKWVIPTGGGYFFSPSISALENVLSV